MNKGQLIERVAKETKLTKAAAGAALEAVTGAIAGELKKGRQVRIVGFGTFQRVTRKARTGRNPKTNEAMRIPAQKIPKFRPGKSLKTAIA